MQPETITLTPTVGATPESTAYNRFRYSGNSSTYATASSEVGAREVLQLSATQGKPSGAFKGQGKASLKMTTDIAATDSLGNSTKAPIIVEVSFSSPVGFVTASDLERARKRVANLLSQDTIIANLQRHLIV